MAFELLSKEYKSIEVVPGAAVSAGDYVTSGSSHGFYLTDVASGDAGTVIVEAEIVEVVKTASQAWAAGVALYVIPGTGAVTTASSSNHLIGYAHEAAASADTVGYIVMNGFAAFMKA